MTPDELDRWAFDDDYEGKQISRAAETEDD